MLHLRWVGHSSSDFVLFDLVSFVPGSFDLGTTDSSDSFDLELYDLVVFDLVLLNLVDLDPFALGTADVESSHFDSFVLDLTGQALCDLGSFDPSACLVRSRPPFHYSSE
jgi:hypothetical protein